MPITIETSPALVSDDTSVTTASFSQIAGGMLVAMVASVADAGAVISGGSLTWTARAEFDSSGVYAGIWTAPTPTSGSMTATATVSGSFTAVGLKVIVVTGQHPTNPIGASNTGTSSTNNLTVSAYTSTAAGSRGFFSGFEFNGLGNPTSTDTGFGWTVASFADTSGIAAYKSANTAAASTSVSFNADAGGSGTADWSWAALEIKPAVDARQRTVVSRAAVHRAASW